jgi:hypothetical protein
MAKKLDTLLAVTVIVIISTVPCASGAAATNGAATVRNDLLSID